MNNTLKQEIADIDKRISNGERYSRERYDMYQVFKEVISKAQSETDADVVTLAGPRIEYWQKQQTIHYSAKVEDAQMAIEKFKEC